MYVTEYRATAANAPLLFWEVTENAPFDDHGKPVTIGLLGSIAGYERRVIGRAQSLDGLVGLLANQDVGEIRVAEVERAWRAAAQGMSPARCRIRPRGTSASGPIVAPSVSYGAATGSSVLAHSGAASQTTSFSVTMMLLILAVVVLWLALI